MSSDLYNSMGSKGQTLVSSFSDPGNFSTRSHGLATIFQHFGINLLKVAVSYRDHVPWVHIASRNISTINATRASEDVGPTETPRISLGGSKADLVSRSSKNGGKLNQVKLLAIFGGGQLKLTTSNSKGLWTWSDKFVSNFCLLPCAAGCHFGG